MAAFRFVSDKQLDGIVNRLQKKTRATVASEWTFDPQDHHLAYMKVQDPGVHPEKNIAGPTEEVTKRVSRPTTASKAARHDFDAQTCHIEYLTLTVPDYPPKIKKIKNPAEQNRIVSAITKGTRASRAARHDFDAQREHVRYLGEQDERYPGHKAYGFRRKSAPFCTIDRSKESSLTERICRPTVASEGGKSLQNKIFDYIGPRLSVTCPEIKGLDTKFRGQKRLDPAQLHECIERLTMTPKRFTNNQRS